MIYNINEINCKSKEDINKEHNRCSQILKGFGFQILKYQHHKLKYQHHKKVYKDKYFFHHEGLKNTNKLMINEDEN